MAFNPNELKLYNDEELGSGFMSKTYKGRNLRNGRLIAIKIWNKRTTCDQAIVDETERMLDFKHQNVVRTLGYCLSNGSVWTVMEYMFHSDLLKYLNRFQGNFVEEEYVNFAYDIANGMRYLHHECMPYCKHQDLAARNCLVGRNGNVKIADFGGWSDNYNNWGNGPNSKPKPAPARWMAPECVPYGNREAFFTRKNDVWAYGVVLFEIWSEGSFPFEGLNQRGVIEALVEEGENPLNYPSNFPRKNNHSLMCLISDCWEEKPSSRPNFKQIVSRLENLYPMYLNM